MPSLRALLFSALTAGIVGQLCAQPVVFQESFDSGVLSPGWVWQANSPVLITPDASGSGYCAGKESLNDVPPPSGELGSILFHDLPYATGASYQMSIAMRVENASMLVASAWCMIGWWGPSGFLDDAYLTSTGAEWEWMQSGLIMPAANTPSPSMRFGILLSINQSAVDAMAYFDNIEVSAYGFTQPAPVRLQARAWLDGAFVPAQSLMRDDLRIAGLIPTVDPYGNGTTVAPTVLAVSGNNAVVDWVRVELRIHPLSGGPVSSAAGLLQRDGDIVAADGSSPLGFNAAPGNYHVVVKHRNHLSVMSAAPITLINAPASLDMRLPGTSAFMRSAPFTDLPRKAVGSWAVMWAGNVYDDDRLRYVGNSNDRDPILTAIGGVAPSATVTGYSNTDVNMDGVVKYVGANNDRDPILVNIGGSTPTAVRLEQVP